MISSELFSKGCNRSPLIRVILLVVILGLTRNPFFVVGSSMSDNVQLERLPLTRTGDDKGEDSNLSMFFWATFKVWAFTSVAVICRLGKFLARAIEIAPEPVPISTIDNCWGCVCLSPRTCFGISSGESMGRS